MGKIRVYLIKRVKFRRQKSGQDLTCQCCRSGTGGGAAGTVTQNGGDDAIPAQDRDPVLVLPPGAQMLGPGKAEIITMYHHAQLPLTLRRHRAESFVFRGYYRMAGARRDYCFFRYSIFRKWKKSKTAPRRPYRLSRKVFFLPPSFMRGGARRAGGVRIFALQIFGKAPFSVKNGQNPLRHNGSGRCPNPSCHLPHKWQCHQLKQP